MSNSAMTGPDEDGYLVFPDISHLREEVKSTRVNFILDTSNRLYERYKSLSTDNQAGELYEDIIKFLIGNGWNEKYMLGDPFSLLRARNAFNRDIIDEDEPLHETKQASSSLRDVDFLIEYFESLLDNIAQNHGFDDMHKRGRYEEMKGNILEREKIPKVKEIGSSIDIPNLPVLSQNILPAKMGIKFRIGNLLSLGTKWEEIERKVSDFSRELTDEVNNIPENISSNKDFFQKRVGEIFGKLKNKYNFPRGFDINISTEEEVELYNRGRYTSPSKKSKKTSVYKSFREVIIKLTLQLPESIPSWIVASLEIKKPVVSFQDFSKKGVYEMTSGLLGASESQSDISYQLPFIIQLSQKSKELRDVSKIYKKIQNDEELITVYYALRVASGVYSFDAIDANAENIIQVWRNREELKKVVEWLGIGNLKEVLKLEDNYSYKELLDVLEQHVGRYLPMPHQVRPKRLVKYKYIYGGGIMKYSYTNLSGTPVDIEFYETPTEENAGSDEITNKERKGKILKSFYKENNVNIEQLFSSLEYYFKTQKSDLYDVHSNARIVSGEKLYQFDIHLRNKDSSSYDTIKIKESNRRLKISVFKNGEEINDLSSQTEAQGIIWEALQRVEKLSDNGQEK